MTKKKMPAWLFWSLMGGVLLLVSYTTSNPYIGLPNAVAAAVMFSLSLFCLAYPPEEK